MQQEQSLEEFKRSHAKCFVEEGLASRFDGSVASLMPNVLKYGSDNHVTPIMLSTRAMEEFANFVIDELRRIGCEQDSNTCNEVG